MRIAKNELCKSKILSLNLKYLCIYFNANVQFYSIAFKKYYLLYSTGTRNIQQPLPRLY